MSAARERPGAGRVRAPTRRLSVCADDFGLASGISAAIDELARRRRLTAIACLVNGPAWPDAARRLAGLPETVDVGLHLNLTEGAPLSPALAARWPRLPGLGRVLLGAHLRRLPLAAIDEEIRVQLAAFADAVGRPPDFVDGHQHVHAFAGVRERVLAAVAGLEPVPALRSTGRLLGPGFDFKRRVIEASGGRALARALASGGIRHNPALIGAYDFRDPDYGGRLRAWLGELPLEGGLLFCHPGYVRPGDPPDAIAAARAREYVYLASRRFDDDLAAAGVELGRVW